MVIYNQRVLNSLIIKSEVFVLRLQNDQSNILGPSALMMNDKSTETKIKIGTMYIFGMSSFIIYRMSKEKILQTIFRANIPNQIHAIKITIHNNSYIVHCH